MRTRKFFKVGKSRKALAHQTRFQMVQVIATLPPSVEGQVMVLGRCDCGKVQPFPLLQLVNGTTKSCKCYRDSCRIGTPPGTATHLQSRTPEYKTWSIMKQRCLNIKHDSYSTYGGRGIKVCPRWLESFESFLSDMGRKPSKDHSIERVNNNGDYEPSNCVWATKWEQAKNRSTNRFLEFNGQRLCLMDWSRKVGIPFRTLRGRILCGWSTERILTEPVRKRRPNGKVFA